MMSQKYTVNLISTYLQQLMAIVTPLILTPIMLHRMGTDMYGLWVLIGSLIGYFGLSHFGFGTTLLKELSSHNDTIVINSYLNTTIAFFVMVIMCLIPLSFFIAYAYPIWFDIQVYTTEAINSFLILFCIFLINLLFNTFGIVLFAKGYLVYKNLISIVGYIILIIGVPFVLYKGLGIVSVALVYLVSTVVVASLQYIYAKKNVSFVLSKKYFDKQILYSMFKPSFYYFIINIAFIVVFHTDNIVISSFLSLKLVALYAIGFKLVNVSQNILFKIVDILVPSIAKMYSDHKYREILKLHNKIQIYSISLGIVGYGILYIYGIDIIYLWIGKDQQVLSEDVFHLIVLFGFIHNWVHTSGMFITAMGIHKKNAYYSIYEACLNITLSVILVHYYGLLGVALGTVLSSLLTTGWLTPRLFYKHIKMKV